MLMLPQRQGFEAARPASSTNVHNLLRHVVIARRAIGAWFKGNSKDKCGVSRSPGAFGRTLAILCDVRQGCPAETTIPRFGAFSSIPDAYPGGDR